MSTAAQIQVTNTGSRPVRLITHGAPNPRGFERALEWVTLPPGHDVGMTLYPRQHLRVEPIA